MPRTSFSDDELDLLVNSLLVDGGRSKAEQLLDPCHEYVSPADPNNRWLQPYEKYFRKEIAYRDFEVHVRHFMCEGNSVIAADIQFKRSSRFPAPFLNRNRSLISKLRKLVSQRYGNSGIEVKDEEGGRQIHFNVSSKSFWWRSSTPFKEWLSELSIYDEPFSSGQTDPSRTSIRNDFVILRLRRKEAQHCGNPDGFASPKPIEKQVEAVITVASNLYLHTIKRADVPHGSLQLTLPDSRYRYLIFSLSTIATVCASEMTERDSVVSDSLNFLATWAVEHDQEFFGGPVTFDMALTSGIRYLREFSDQWESYFKLEKEGTESIDSISSMIHSTETNVLFGDDDKVRLGELALEVVCRTPAMRDAFVELANR